MLFFLLSQADSCRKDIIFPATKWCLAGHNSAEPPQLVQNCFKNQSVYGPLSDSVFVLFPFGFNLQQVHHPIWFILVSFYWHCENDSAKLDHKHLPLFTPSPYARIHSPWWSLWNPSAPLVVFMTCDGGEPWALFACLVEGKLGPCQQVETFLLQACNQPRLENEMKKTWSC